MNIVISCYPFWSNTRQSLISSTVTWVWSLDNNFGAPATFINTNNNNNNNNDNNNNK